MDACCHFTVVSLLSFSAWSSLWCLHDVCVSLELVCWLVTWMLYGVLSIGKCRHNDDGKIITQYWKTTQRMAFEDRARKFAADA